METVARILMTLSVLGIVMALASMSIETRFCDYRTCHEITRMLIAGGVTTSMISAFSLLLMIIWS